LIEVLPICHSLGEAAVLGWKDYTCGSVNLSKEIHMSTSKRQRPKEHEDDGLLALPFVKDDPEWTPESERGPRDFWAVETTGDAWQDWTLGEEYAKIVLDYMTKEQFSPLLGYIVDAMILKGELLGAPSGRIIVGFMEEMARCAMFGRHILRTQEMLQRSETIIIRRAPEEEPVVIYGIAKPAPFRSIEIGRRR
jgi:hypothetical protein